MVNLVVYATITNFNEIKIYHSELLASYVFVYQNQRSFKNRNSADPNFILLQFEHLFC